MYKLVFFVPDSHKEEVKQAVFAAGAGQFRNYDRCSWETEGAGQFRPLSGAEPFLGKRGQTELVAEYRVEMICKDEHLRAVVAALLSAHPYEEPAYELVRIKTAEDLEGEHDE